ncbi:MAG: hypothetical protein AAF585_06930, partial [Verrucomicrobiota bacterium]
MSTVAKAQTKNSESKKSSPNSTRASTGLSQTPAGATLGAAYDADWGAPMTGQIQPKLEVAPSDDSYEREADAVADKVMLSPAANGNDGKDAG